MKTRTTRTPQQVRADWRRVGMTQAEWARRHGYPESSVSQVMSGKNACSRGIGHQIAVLLGIKDGEIVEGCDHGRA
jgi:gp16 family phage-associated protein